jgi:N-methylhydantoinase B
LLTTMSIKKYEQGMDELDDHADRITANTIAGLQVGECSFTGYLDDDGCGQSNIQPALTLRIKSDHLKMDFRDSSEQVAGNLNCPESVVAAAAFYCTCCLLPEDPPACEGLFRRIHLQTRAGSIVNANPPAAAAAGNVETSSRLVDLVFGALAKALTDRIPAASQGTMNNVAMGHNDDETGARWDYYKTLAGGIGGGPNTAGRDAVHSYMTNTLNTPVESLEMHYPLRVHRYAVRRDSGGKGKHSGGAGIVREYEFLDQAQLTLLSERRLISPWGRNE